MHQRMQLHMHTPIATPHQPAAPHQPRRLNPPPSPPHPTPPMPPPPTPHACRRPTRSRPSSPNGNRPLPEAGPTCRCSGRRAPTGSRSTSIPAWRWGSRQVGLAATAACAVARGWLRAAWACLSPQACRQLLLGERVRPSCGKCTHRLIFCHNQPRSKPQVIQASRQRPLDQVMDGGAGAALRTELPCHHLHPLTFRPTFLLDLHHPISRMLPACDRNCTVINTPQDQS
jgi:hypothetical protein